MMNLHSLGVSHVLALAVSTVSTLAVTAVDAQVVTRESTGEPVQGQVYQTQPKRNQYGQPVEPVQANTTAATDLFFEVQKLREEIMQLRGALEEQAYEIKRLKQQRLDDYMDLDRRVAALTVGGQASPATNRSPVQTQQSVNQQAQPVIVEQPVSGASEQDEYRAAFTLLSNRKMAESLIAFESLLEKYPNGKYAANSYYWMGEIYGHEGDTARAKQQFNTLIERFPDSRKAIDGRFKLAKLLFQDGDLDGARAQLQIVVDSNTETAKLAEAFIRDNL